MKTDELLTELLAEVRGLRGDLASRKPCAGAPIEPAVTTLMRCISDFAEGPRPFSTWELLDAATLPECAALRDAIVTVLGANDATNAKRLGRLLMRNEGVDMGGLTLVRDGEERGVARWRVEGFLD